MSHFKQLNRNRGDLGFAPASQHWTFLFLPEAQSLAKTSQKISLSKVLGINYLGPLSLSVFLFLHLGFNMSLFEHKFTVGKSQYFPDCQQGRLFTEDYGFEQFFLEQ